MAEQEADRGHANSNVSHSFHSTQAEMAAEVSPPAREQRPRVGQQRPTQEPRLATSWQEDLQTKFSWLVWLFGAKNT